jgi:hypothetical protein
MPVTALDPSIVHGVLIEQRDGGIVVGLPNTDYRLYLAVQEPLAEKSNDRIRGKVLARAMRVDVVRFGGRFIEPVIGRPRRLQGTICGVDAERNQITVNCVCPFVCELMLGQKASCFAVGELVGFDIERGAMFIPG